MWRYWDVPPFVYMLTVQKGKETAERIHQWRSWYLCILRCTRTEVTALFLHYNLGDPVTYGEFFYEYP